MTFTFADLGAFLADYWLAVLVVAGIASGWLFICHELCLAAEAEGDLEDSPTEPPMRPRALLTSRQCWHHAHPCASFRIRHSRSST